jgi:hypothetical protein
MNILPARKLKRLKVLYLYNRLAEPDEKLTIREIERCLQIKRTTISKYFRLWSAAYYDR